MLDGAARVHDVVRAARDDGQPAVAITDHGVMYGVIDFYQAARNEGVKPIIGVEAYVTPGSRFDRPPRNRNVRFHLTLLAENNTGYQNLMKLVSKAYLEGYYYKPRMDLDLLAEHSEGIIAASGCLGGEVPQLLAPDASREEGNQGQVGDFDAALTAAARYQDLFGKENFYIELQDHGIDAQQRVLPDLVEIARRIGAPLLATNDSHYTRQEEADAHDVLLCIQTGATINDPNRFKFQGQEFYLKTAREMRSLFPDDLYPGAADNTLAIAERTNVELRFGEILLPQFPVPEGETEMSYLRDLVFAGARTRYGEPLPVEVIERAEHELRIIGEMGFPAYFLIVWDLIRYAREKGIRVGPGRGSAAGSIVSYCLRITDLDPLRYALIFERFLNPGRRQMPDIDMDFDERYRSDVIRYAAERYGSDHVAQIVTFSTIKGRQALRDSARVLGFPYGFGDRIAKMMPPAILGAEASLTQCLTDPGKGADPALRDFFSNAAQLRAVYETEEDARTVIDTARGLEGLRRQDSIHAAAVVISPEPLTNLVPLQQKGEGAEIVTQYEMHGVEDLGLLKMDFLGLRNLATIDRALELIEQSTGEKIDIDSIPLDDPETFEMIRAGDTIGVFQLEGSAMRSLIRALQPETFDHIIAVNALFRPGPMGMNMHYEYADRKNGRKPVEYPHPAIEPFLRSTYGIIVYQEQVMQVAQAVAGYSMTEADMLRKAMGKKVKSMMAQERDKFVAGCVAAGNPEKLGKELWDAIEPFAGYGFNKSHSAAYGYVAYQTAWLKAHYPAEYLAALLTSTKKDKDRTALYLSECRSQGIEVLVPDVNRSELDFVVRDGRIVFGMSAIRNVGEGVVERILAARREAGPFKDFQDFVDRVDLSALNKRTIESLIKAGAFDSFNVTRRGLMLSFEQILDATLTRRRNEEMGQFSLFGGESGPGDMEPVSIPSVEWDKRVRLSFEKEMLGLFISDHPLLGVEHLLGRFVTCTIPELWEMDDTTSVTVGGLVGSINRRFTRKGEPMVFFELEDLEGSVEVVAFPKAVMAAGPMIREDAVLVVSGHLDHRGDDIKVIAREVIEPELRSDQSVRLKVPAVQLSPDLVSRLQEILANHPGPAPVYIEMTSDGGSKVWKLSDEYRVEPRSALYAELRELLGSRAVT
ncbi:DNA polymerase III subunit alpha [bacterium BMS3Abin02]|nr:DNA polymerase III subunit alpha [bacterium BMS3Abin02]